MTQLSRINLALTGVVVLLTALVLLGPDPARDQAPAPLTPLNPETLRRIRIHRGAGELLAFDRDIGVWRMTAPFSLAVDPDKLQALTRIAATPSRRSFPADQADLAELGLAPAPVQLALDGLSLKVGGTEPIRRRRYVLMEGRVHLIDDLFQHHLLAAAAAFAERRPFPNPIDSAALDGEALGPKALQLLGKVQAQRVGSGDPPEQAFRLEIRLGGGGAPLSFRLEASGERLWRMQPPLLYLLETPLTPDRLRD